MRRVHHGAATDPVEVHDLDRRVVVVDRVVLGPGADVGAGAIVAKGARLPIPARAGERRGVHPAALFEAEDVHPRVGETPGHRRAGRAGANDQHIHGIVHLVFPLPGAACLDRILRCNAAGIQRYAAMPGVSPSLDSGGSIPAMLEV